MAARYLLYGVVALTLVTAVWVGLRRMAWDAAYHTVGLVVPAQELDSTLTEDELRDYLQELRAQGVVALSVELSDFSGWGLKRAPFPNSQVLRTARDVGLGIALVVDADYGERLAPELSPQFVIIISENGSSVPSWVTARFASAMLGIPEFSEPSGLGELYRQGWRNFVRVHAIKSAELDRLGLEGALARWERAVQERTIRLLWVTDHKKFPQYMERLSQRIRQLGMELGEPSAPAPFENSYAVYLIVGAGFVSFSALVLMRSSQLSVLWVCVVVLALMGVWDIERARQILALAIAALAPWLVLRWGTERFLGWKLLMAVSALSSCAGLVVAALLSDLSYFLKLAEFRGVKLALVAPTICVVCAQFYRWRELGWSALRAPWRSGAWLIFAVGMGAIFFVLERSGNLPIIPVARWEELLRERLEDWLRARPRFKEFLGGHPALLLWQGGSSLSQVGFLALGALGQASIVNTFVHLHTPVVLSLWRTFNGLVLGMLVGLFLRLVLLWIRQWRRHEAS